MRVEWAGNITSAAHSQVLTRKGSRSPHALAKSVSIAMSVYTVILKQRRKTREQAAAAKEQRHNNKWRAEVDGVGADASVAQT